MTIANTTDRTSIFIADRGFVWVCKGYEEDASGKWVHLMNARCIRQWGTDGGLAQLINGPRKETALDAVAPILTLAYHAVIAIIPCDDSAWAPHL